MIFQNKLKSAIKAAESQTATRLKIVALLNSEVRTLSSTAGRLIEAENAFADSAADCLVNESKQPADDSAIVRIRSEIKRAGVVVSGLRSKIRELIPGFSIASQAISSELPAHYEAVESAFRLDYDKAVAAFSVMLGRRAELERALGRKFDLVSPVAVAPNPQLAADARRPMELLTSIAPYLEAAAASHISLNRQDASGFDAGHVYILGRQFLDSDGLSLNSGAPVVRECFGVGMLRQLVEIGHAYRAEDPRIAETRHIANQEILRARAAEADRQRQAESGTCPASESNWPVGLSTQDVRLAPELPGAKIQERPEFGSPLPWSDVTRDLNSGKTV